MKSGNAAMVSNHAAPSSRFATHASATKGIAKIRLGRRLFRKYRATSVALCSLRAAGFLPERRRSKGSNNSVNAASHTVSRQMFTSRGAIVQALPRQRFRYTAAARPTKVKPIAPGSGVSFNVTPSSSTTGGNPPGVPTA